ncbi:SBBP repeat-containing protein [Myxococcaceae bacterium GXIMD 01537]
MRSALLMGAMSLLAIPGCQGEEPAPAETASSTQELVCNANLVPAMTSATAPSGAVTRSGAFGGYEAWQAFDSSATSMWISEIGQTPAWIAYEFSGGAKQVLKYALNYANGSITSRAPKNWTFEGWNGSAWVVLDTRTNQTGWAGHERREFTLASAATYAKFRLNVTDDNDSRPDIEVISLGKVELLGCVADPQPLWTRLQGASGEFTYGYDLTADADGRNYSVGMTTGALPGPLMGALDAFLHAHDASGSVLWKVQVGASGVATTGYGVARSRNAEDLFMGGSSGGALDGGPKVGAIDAFVTKYRNTGVRQWTRQVGVSGATTEGYGVGVDASGNAFLVGSTDGSLDGNTRIGRYDAFVTKYDSAGTKQWTRTVGAASTDTIARRAAADDAGNVYVAGWTTGALDGNVKVGAQDFFITKYNAAGVKQWTRQHGAVGGQVGLYGAALDASGNLYVSGHSYGGIDGYPGSPNPQMFLAKYDASGSKQWVRQFGAPHGAWARNISINASGVYVSGSGKGDLTNPSAPTSTAHTYVARYDTSGNLRYILQQQPATLSGVAKSVTTEGIGLDGSGNVYLSGHTEGSLGGVNLQGSPDGFVMKLSLP